MRMLALARKPPPARPVSGAPFRVRTVTSQDISPGLVSAWSELEMRACEPNAYLSPHFVLPALRHLDPGEPILIVLVESAAPGTGELLGVGVFRPVLGTRRFPIPHLVGYRSKHSFLGGLLLDRERGADALEALFDHLRPLRWRWHGLDLVDVWGDGLQSDLIKDATARRGLFHHERDLRARAVLVTPRGSQARVELAARTLQARDKGARRYLRKLEERGRVSWELHRHAAISDAAVESFLALEHRGWKGESNTSLRSNRAEEAFFRDVVSGFGAVGRALFTELTLDGQVVASTSNFVSGDAGFAFKAGWLPELAKMSPGVLNEVELMRSFLQGRCGDLALFDSGAAAGSYIDKLWSDRRPLVSSAIALSSMGGSVLRVGRAARAVQRRLQSAGLIATESDAA